MIARTLNLDEPLKDLSLLLLGPRQTGKSTLLHSCYPKAKVFDLLDPELFRDLNKSPLLLKELVKQNGNLPIIIDEIQKLPELLDVVQTLIEGNKNQRYILTGSSARKLKRQGQNLLGGRAYPIQLYPITSIEFLSFFGEKSDLNPLLQIGGLPSVLTSKSPLRVLKAYVGIYLQEEIKAEGFARSLSDFSKFLEVAALTNSEQLDFASVARDVQLSPRTVSAYYEILQDTLIGHLLEPFKVNKSRKAVVTPKFYFFDVGICNFLTGREKISAGTSEYGKALEHFIFTELIAYKHYMEKSFDLFYWRSTSQFEVDFIIRLKSKKMIGIEVKGTSHIDKDDLKGLKAFEEDFPLHKKLVVCNERSERVMNGETNIMPYKVFCTKLWANELF